MARILIVEKQSFFANALIHELTALEHSFSRTESCKSARLILEQEDFDGVIADAKMDGLAGVEFSRWIARHKPTPVILMCNFADQADPLKPFGLEGVGLLIKPFSREGVKEALLALPEGAESAPRPALIGLSKTTLKKAGVAEFHIFHYVKGNPERLVTRGDAFILDNLNVPEDTRFYTDRASLSALLESSIVQGQAAATNTVITAEKRADLMQNALQLANEQMALMGVSEAMCETTGEIFSAYLKAIEDGAVWEAISDLDTYSRPVYAQTLASTLVCILIAQEQMYSAGNCFKLMTAAMFHDVGLTSLDPALLATPRALLSMKDRQHLDHHVEIGSAILQKSGWLTEEICTIVAQHHEYDSGTGFPRGLKGHQIHPMARVLRVADELVLSVMKSAGQRGVPPLRAVELMKERPELDQKSVRALHRILSMDTHSAAKAA